MHVEGSLLMLKKMFSSYVIWVMIMVILIIIIIVLVLVHFCNVYCIDCGNGMNYVKGNQTKYCNSDNFGKRSGSGIDYVMALIMVKVMLMITVTEMGKLMVKLMIIIMF